VDGGDGVVVTCDLSALGHPDADTLDALLRLHVVVARMGGSLRLRNACPELRDLLALAGLDCVLRVI
jgi:anti-anti-sigma regulatory factor